MMETVNWQATSYPRGQRAWHVLKENVGTWETSLNLQG